jgi:hypothetical protein
MKAIACALMLTALLGGCARMRSTEPSASPRMDTSVDKVSCEQSGGKWNTNTRNCDR